MKEKGQSLLEMVFAMVFLLTLLAGIVDLGRALYVYLALREASEEGAIYASLCPPFTPMDASKTHAHIRASSHYPVNLKSETVQVSTTFTDPPVIGTQIEVRVTETKFRPIMPFWGVFMEEEVEIGAKVGITAAVDVCQLGE